MTRVDGRELASSLHPAVAERIHVVQDGPIPWERGWILVWMRTAVRAYENPCLDAALRAGKRLDLPVFVYHAVSERYPYASDRHHRFILEGARDVSAALRARGVGYALHVERPGHRGPWLVELATRAALVLTERMPVQPLNHWVQRLANRVDTPLWEVDTACVVPTTLVERSTDRAFRYRKATRRLAEERERRPWPEAPVVHEPYVPELPFEPVDPERADLDALIASCDIDHTVAPVPDTPGGTRAGLARWRTFRDKRLRSYHRRRNDASTDGVSRMSAYLHYGHVSPFQVVREALDVGGEGAEKYVDELLVWREMAYRWCVDHPDPHGVHALPTWARQTLAEQERAPREQLLSWEALSRSATGDALWDLCQDSLRIHGELHNNVRMTWGKAIPRWTPNTATALTALIDLNHRYALDGRDPASYGGLLWCLGAFDRPFTPAEPILGQVRPRSSRAHARRLDMHRYADVVHRPRRVLQPDVVVIGAGISGLMTARVLADHGLNVSVVDKARGAGGRTSTRRGEGPSWDHGAPCFVATDPTLLRYLSSWSLDGVVTSWEPRCLDPSKGAVTHLETHWQGVGGMNAIARHLAADLDVRYRSEVSSLRAGGRGWLLTDSEGNELATARHVVVTAPPPQAAALVRDVDADLAASLEAAVLVPQLTAMCHLVDACGTEADVMIGQGVLHRAWRMTGRPGRPSGEAWVLHASEEASRSYLETPDALWEPLLSAFQEGLGMSVVPLTSTIHRWRYLQGEVPGSGRILCRDGLTIAGADLAGGPLHLGVQRAFESGVAAAARVLALTG